MRETPSAVSVKDKITDHSTDSPLLAAFSPSERRAILFFQRHLSFQEEATPDLETVIVSWQSRCASAWRREKMRRDVKEQIAQIDQHRYFLGIELQREVKPEAAALDWIEKHAEAWREWWEEQPESCPDFHVFGLGSDD